MCESQVSSSVSTETHYQLTCKRLFEEAGELVGLATEVFQHTNSIHAVIIVVYIMVGG